MTSTLIHGARSRPEAREIELLAQAHRGDVAAFEQLAAKHVNRLFLATLRLLGDRGDAEDVVQETLLRAWRGIHGFRRRSSFYTWLYRIAVNEANRSVEKGARRPDTIRLAEDQLQVSSSAGHRSRPRSRVQRIARRAANGAARTPASPPHRHRPARHRRTLNPRGSRNRRRRRGSLQKPTAPGAAQTACHARGSGPNRRRRMTRLRPPLNTWTEPSTTLQSRHQWLPLHPPSRAVLRERGSSLWLRS
jgi:RNA polymerase sigma factor (sigma-70 family)